MRVKYFDNAKEILILFIIVAHVSKVSKRV